MSVHYSDESWTMPPGLTYRDFLPDPAPDHDPTGTCTCHDCLDADAWDAAEEAWAGWRDEEVRDG